MLQKDPESRPDATSVIKFVQKQFAKERVNQMPRFRAEHDTKNVEVKMDREQEWHCDTTITLK